MMPEYAQINDTVSAATSAMRLANAAGSMQDILTEAANLIKQNEQLSPLFGEDGAGRHYRHNYSETAEQVRETAEELAEALKNIGIVATNGVNALSETDLAGARALGSQAI